MSSLLTFGFDKLNSLDRAFGGRNSIAARFACEPKCADGIRAQSNRDPMDFEPFDNGFSFGLGARADQMNRMTQAVESGQVLMKTGNTECTWK